MSVKGDPQAVEYERELGKVNYAVQAYARAANDIAGPRELEANLLLQAAAKFQSPSLDGIPQLPDPGEGSAPGGASREPEDAWCVRNVRDLFAGDKASEETF